jgi:hypothetical protein
MPYVGLDPSTQSILGGADEQVVVIFQGLVSFMFEYFDPGAEERPARWVKVWDAKEEKRLPSAVSMTMVARDPKGGPVSRHMVIPILARPDPRPAFINPFESRPRRFSEDDPRFVR